MTRRASAALIGLIAVLLAVVPGTVPAWAGSLARSMPGASFPGEPGPITNLNATVVSGSEIDLTWTQPSDGTSLSGYDVFDSTNQGQEQSNPAVNGQQLIQDTSYQVTGLNSCQTYWFEVDSVDSGGTVVIPSSPDEVSAETSCTTPTVSSGGGSSSSLAAPTELIARPVSSTEIDLTWTAPSGDTPAGYDVYDGTTSGGEGSSINSQLIQGNTFQVTGLDSGTIYYFVVDASDGNGNYSNYSNEANATTLNSDGSSSAVIGPVASSGSSGPPWGALLLPFFLAVLAGGLIARRRRRRRRRPAPQTAPASSVHAVAHTGPPAVVVIRPTGTDATLTVRVESHKAPSITTIEEVPPP